MDLQQWMTNELRMARKVLLVCNEAYKERAEGRLGGVGWETMIIQGDMASLPADSTKYQIVVRESDIDKGLPLYLKTKFVFHASDKAQDKVFRQDLVKELLDLPIDPTLQKREFNL